MWCCPYAGGLVLEEGRQVRRVQSVERRLAFSTDCTRPEDRKAMTRPCVQHDPHFCQLLHHL